jgi:hypothetical protein
VEFDKIPKQAMPKKRKIPNRRIIKVRSKADLAHCQIQAPCHFTILLEADFPTFC